MDLFSIILTCLVVIYLVCTLFIIKKELKNRKDDILLNKVKKEINKKFFNKKRLIILTILLGMVCYFPFFKCWNSNMIIKYFLIIGYLFLILSFIIYLYWNKKREQELDVVVEKILLENYSLKKDEQEYYIGILSNGSRYKFKKTDLDYFLGKYNKSQKIKGEFIFEFEEDNGFIERINNNSIILDTFVNTYSFINNSQKNNAKAKILKENNQIKMSFSAEISGHTLKRGAYIIVYAYIGCKELAEAIIKGEI